MAVVHIGEIQKWLVERGEIDASPASGRFYLEIRFDDQSTLDARPKIVDDEYANQTIVVDSSIGFATICFDAAGRLRSIDWS